jgi:hypothetical protein
MRLATKETRLASPKRSDDSLALRFAVANLLRVARSDLDDARPLMRKRHGRNAAIFLRQALALLAGALAASEHGWPLKRWNAGLRAVPEANPFQPELLEIDALLGQDAAPAVRTDGRLAPEPDNGRLAPASDRLAALLRAIAKAFDTDITGTGPAGRVTPIRPEPVPKPSEPESLVAAPTARQSRKRHPLLATAEPLEAQAAAPRPARMPVRSSPVPKEMPRTKPAPPPGGALTVSDPPPERSRTPEREPHTARTVVQWPGQRPVRSPSKAALEQQVTASGSDAEPQPVEQPLSARRSAPDVPSTVFWSLMDHWKLGDLEALDLLRHPGDLTKK